MENKINDRMISEIIRSVKHKIPKKVETLLSGEINRVKHKKNFFARKQFLWLPASAIAIIICLVLLKPFQKERRDFQPPINEIRTELEIKDKNIKIIWIQKKNFNLRRENK